MLKTKVYYLKAGERKYLLHDGAGNFFWNEGGLPFSTVNAAIDYIRGIGEDDVHCDIQVKERRS